MSKYILGYGVCGSNEKYLKQTLDCFKSLCDHTVILGNRIDGHSKDLIESYGFDILEDDREWGLNQHLIKQDFVGSLIKYKPEWLICLDMDEVLDITRPELEDIMDKTDSMYVYIVNLWNDGWKRQWSFWNIRVWKWNGMTKFVNRPLHCGLAPEWAYYYGSYCPIVLYHYGLKDKEDRDRKIKRYKKYDPDSKYRDKSYYEALADNTCEVLDKDFIRSAIIRESLPIKHRIDMAEEKKFVYVRRQDGALMDIPESLLQEHLNRGFTLVEPITPEPTEEPVKPKRTRKTK